MIRDKNADVIKAIRKHQCCDELTPDSMIELVESMTEEEKESLREALGVDSGGDTPTSLDALSVAKLMNPLLEVNSQSEVPEIVIDDVTYSDLTSFAENIDLEYMYRGGYESIIVRGLAPIDIPFTRDEDCPYSLLYVDFPEDLGDAVGIVYSNNNRTLCSGITNGEFKLLYRMSFA